MDTIFFCFSLLFKYLSFYFTYLNIVINLGRAKTCSFYMGNYTGTISPNSTYQM